MSTPSCQTCAGAINDLTGIAQLRKIERMISDNYTIIFISFLLIVILIFILWYFSTQLHETLKIYYKAAGKRNEDIVGKASTSYNPDDAEDYDDEPTYIDSTTHFDSGKAEFVKNMNDAYKEYNKEKADYIRTTYSIDNDDDINTSAMYSKHDDYEYTPDANK